MFARMSVSSSVYVHFSSAREDASMEMGYAGCFSSEAHYFFVLVLEGHCSLSKSARLNSIPSLPPNPRTINPILNKLALPITYYHYACDSMLALRPHLQYEAIGPVDGRSSPLYRIRPRG